MNNEYETCSFLDTFDNLQYSMDRLRHEVVLALLPTMEKFNHVLICYARIQFYNRLRAKLPKFMHQVAKWVAMKCPERWL